VRRSASFLFSLTLFAVCPAVIGQAQKGPSASQPAPQISGRLIGTNGPQQVILEYSTKGGRGTFIGKLHSTCTLSTDSGSQPTRSVPLLEIPRGSRVTLFYVRRLVNTKQGRRTENVVLGMRFDKSSASGKFSAGQTFACFKAIEPRPAN